MNWKAIRLRVGQAACAALIVLVASGHLMAQSPAKKPTPSKSVAAKSTSPKSVAATNVAKKSAPSRQISPAELSARKSLGVKSAPITMQVFSDFQCPMCRELYLSVVRQVIDNYVSAGKVYLVHRDFPLPGHQHSREASRYANAAAMINRTEKVVSALFDKQSTWSTDGNVDGVVAAVLTPAEMKQVRSLAGGNSLDAAIDSDVEMGHQYRVTQTPTTIITYKGTDYPVVGFVTYGTMKTFLEQLLRN